MTEDAPGKSGVDAPQPSEKKTPEAMAPSDPSPPRLAPEAPTKTPEKKEEKEGEKKDNSPSEDPPTLIRASPQQQQQQQPTPPQPQQPQQATPQVPQGKPRGRPPGVPNKNSAAVINQINQMNQIKHQLAQQAAQAIHRNGHGVPQNMQMGPSIVHVNADGQQQFVHMIQGQPGQQFIQHIYPGPMQGRPQFAQLRPTPQQMHQQQQQQQQQQPRPQQQQPVGPNGTVPVLIPVPAGHSGNNPIPLPPQALFRQPDGTFGLRPDFFHGNVQPIVIDPNGQRQNHVRPPQDRLANGAAAAGSSGSRTSEWVGGLPQPSANGAPPSLQPMPQLQQLQQPPSLPPAADAAEDEEQEAAPHLAAETEPILNVESLNVEEAFLQESNGGSGRKKKADKNAKVHVHEIEGFKIIQTAEASNSSHLDGDDYEPVPDDDDDQSDNSYEGKEEDANRKPVNGPGLVHQAAQWMQNRLEMDIPREERKPKDTPQSHKPSTRADGKKTRGKQKANELKSLIQMDFGPKENSRRAREVIPVVIQTATGDFKNAKTIAQNESPKNLRNKELRSSSAAGGSVATAANGKETRSLRNRDSLDKAKECRACGKPLDEKRGDKQHPGYCDEYCHRIESSSPTNTEDEDDEMTSVRTDETPEPTSRKKESSTPASGKRLSGNGAVVKEEPKEEEVPATPTPRRRGRWPVKKEEESVSPQKKEKEKEQTTPKKEEKKKEVKEEKKIKEEQKEEEMEQEKQKSPAAKRRSVMEKKEEPPAKTRKVETAAPPAAQQTPLLAAALAAPSIYSQQQPAAAAPPPLPVQQLQQPRLPAAVAEVAPSPAVAAAPAAAAAHAAAAPTAPEMDSLACRQLSVEQVRAWVEQLTGKPEVAKLFEDEDVDGQTLLTLKYDDLRGDLKLSLGMAKKVYSAIEDIIKRKPSGSDE